MALETRPAMLMITSSPAPDSASSVTSVCQLWYWCANRRTQLSNLGITAPPSVLQHAADHGLALAETLAFEQRGHLIEQVGNGKALRALLLAIHASRTERGIGGRPGGECGGPDQEWEGAAGTSPRNPCIANRARHRRAAG